ncbi:MAG: hypothetical protein KAS66_05215 [Candidatus Omnitrophica bacterium]|nr:hypothetical protein [Candidatus Omnitrophota bacterium]
MDKSMKEIKTLEEGLKSLLESQAKLIKAAEILGVDEFTVYRLNRELAKTKEEIN